MVRPTGPALDRPPLVLESRAEILSLAPVLQALADRCEQAGAMHWLPYFLDPARLGWRQPRLVLFPRTAHIVPEHICVDDLEAAALFYEYRVFGVGTGVLATGDAVGFSSVIAPQKCRARVAAAAATALTGRGAGAVLATYQDGREPDMDRLDSSEALWATRQRRVGRMLPLLETLDATLARMGKSTRFNLRYYRRRLEKQMACRFVTDAAALLRGADLEAINRTSLNPLPGAEFERRVASARSLEGSFLCGLRDVDGRWLSLAGGWRQGSTTVLHWQMNAAGLEKYSIGTVMRSYLLEHEIARGAKKLMIYGGTPHTMRHSFEQASVSDVVMLRSGLHGRALRTAARWATALPWRARRNFVLRAIADPELRWRTSHAVEGSAPAGLLAPVRTTPAA